MGAANPDRVPMIRWRGGCETVQQMIDDNWIVFSHCLRCRVKQHVNLHLVKAANGADFSLWNRRPPCKVVGCDGRVRFEGKAPAMSQARELAAEWPPDKPPKGQTGYKGPR